MEEKSFEYIASLLGSLASRAQEVQYAASRIRPVDVLEGLAHLEEQVRDIRAALRRDPLCAAYERVADHTAATAETTRCGSCNCANPAGPDNYPTCRECGVDLD